MAVQSAIEFGDGLGIEIVDIIAGQEQPKHFKVHFNLLSTKISYFQKMFNRDLKEGEERKAHLTDEPPGALSLFLEWLYRGSFRALEEVGDKTPILSRVQLNCFAEKIYQEDLMDYTIYSLLRELIRLARLPKTSTIFYAYENTLSTSQLRKFVARSFVRCFVHSPNPEGDWTVEELSTAMTENQELCSDLLALPKALLNTKLLDPRGLACSFHVHGKWVGMDCPCDLVKERPLLDKRSMPWGGAGSEGSPGER